MKKYLLGAALVGAMAAATPASAAQQITYTLSGTFNVNLNGTEYDGIDITFNGVGDPAAVNFSGLSYTNLLTSLAATVPGVGVVTLPDSYTFFTNQTSHIAGVFDNFSLFDIFDIQSDSFASYDGSTSLGPISVTYPAQFFPGAVIPSDYGDAQIVGASNLTFAAVVTGTPPIGGAPEPAEWTMMLVGFFGLGAMVRRNRLGFAEI